MASMAGRRRTPGAGTRGTADPPRVPARHPSVRADVAGHRALAARRSRRGAVAHPAAVQRRGYRSVLRPRAERVGPLSPTGAGVSSIGTVGRLDPVKNQASLLQAFAASPARFPASACTIVGDGPLRMSLERASGLWASAGRSRFAGARNDTPDLMRSFDVFVLPSINEGISNTILEAMATGLPVVAAQGGRQSRTRRGRRHGPPVRSGRPRGA